MSAVVASEFMPIPGAESHEINRAGIVRRRANPARSNGGRNQFRKGYRSKAKQDGLVLLTQNGKRLLCTTRRVLVQRAFGSSWPAGNRGETNGHSKLTERDVIEIRERYARGESLSGLAGEFKVGRANIHAIVNGRSWKQLLPGSEYASRHRHCRV